MTPKGSPELDPRFRLRLGLVFNDSSHSSLPGGVCEPGFPVLKGDQIRQIVNLQPSYIFIERSKSPRSWPESCLCVSLLVPNGKNTRGEDLVQSPLMSTEASEDKGAVCKLWQGPKA